LRIHNLLLLPILRVKNLR